MMNSEKLAGKLIAAARADEPSAAVPYAFEKRVTAQLEARLPLDPISVWSRVLWRAAIACLAVPLMLGYWAVSSSNGTRPDANVSQEFEDSVYASVVQQFVDTAEW
jgi:hypothetical protein